MERNKRDWSVNRDAVKALVAVYGPRETSRQTKLPLGTVLSWCRRYKWKKAALVLPTSGINGGVQEARGEDAGDVLTKALLNHRNQSTLNLAHYVDKAAKAAVKAKEPLGIAKNVSHVAQVYKTLYPPEQGGELIEGQILIGAAAVTDNHAEMMAIAEEVSDVRQELSDQRPQGD